MTLTQPLKNEIMSMEPAARKELKTMLDFLDDVTAGTGAAGKALIPSSNSIISYSTLRTSFGEAKLTGTGGTGIPPFAGVQYGANEYTAGVLAVTGIADNTATTIFTVTVPNQNVSACIRLTLLSRNGSTDQYESSRCAEGLIVIAKGEEVECVPQVATLALAQIATIGGGATHTLAYSVGAVAGGSGINTFAVQVTINDSGNTGGNALVAFMEVLNSSANGITLSFD